MKMNLKQRLCCAIANRLPQSLVYWCGIRILTFAHLTKWDKRNPMEIGLVDALEHFAKNPK